MRMLVIGASGFVGAAVVEAAGEAGWEVRGAGHRRPARAMDAVAVDLRDPASVRSACRGAAVVVHAAGRAHMIGASGQDAFDAVNVQGTATVVEAAAAQSVERLVLVSSVAVYGDPRPAPPVLGMDETAPCRPTSAYARSKLAAEVTAVAAAAAAGLNLVVIRLATVYGAGDPGNVARLMRAIDRGRFVWIGTGQNRKTLIHIDDAGHGLVAAAAPDGPVGTYNLGAAPVTMAAVVTELAQALDRAVPGVRLPAGACLTAAKVLRLLGSRGASIADSLAKWTTEDVFDGRRFEAAFGWRPAVPLRRGIQAEVAWYRESSLGRMVPRARDRKSVV